MDIDSLDPIPFSKTEADTLVFALREMVVRLPRAIFVAGANKVPSELSSFRGRPSFFFGLPAFVMVVVFVGFFVSFFTFGFGFVAAVVFFLLVVDVFFLLKDAADAACLFFAEVVVTVPIAAPS